MIDQEDDREYLVDLEKLMTSQVASTYWAHNMDMLAITTFDNLLELYRIGEKAQKIFGAEQAKPIKYLAFSPDSHLIVYGLIDGQLKIVKSQNGERVVIVDGIHKNQIQNLSFLPFWKLDSTTFIPGGKKSIQSRLILPISPHKNCNKNAIIKINYFREMGSDFTLLLSSQKQKTLFLLNGFIPAAQINYRQAKLSNTKVLYSYFDGIFRSIVAQQISTTCRLHLVEYSATELSNFKEQIIKFNTLIAYISEIFTFIQSSYDAVQVLIRDILRQYMSKINLIDDPNTQNVNPCNELFKYLNYGVTSPALIHFFTKQVFDSKLLQKLDETLNSIFAQLHDLLLQSIQNSLEKATLLLKQLVNLSQIKKYQVFGIKPTQLKEIQEKIIRLYTMGEILLVDSTQAKFDIRNLLVWLNKSTIKSSPENQVEIENTKSYLNRYTVDFNRLHAFLIGEQTFKLQNLANFFSKDKESRHRMQIKEAQFRILSSPLKKQPNPEQINNYKKLQSLLEVENVYISNEQKMDEEYIFKNFKLQIKELSDVWKQISQIPVAKISNLISKQCTKHSIGHVQLNEIFQFQIKTRIIKNELLLYYVEREEDFDKLVEFNCHKKIKRYLKSTSSHILSIAVSQDVIAVFQEKMSGKKIVGQVANEQFDGEQIQVGRMISKVQGQLDINSSMKGLNSLVIDKSKLVIFD